jgi:hypothetical protein
VVGSSQPVWVSDVDSGSWVGAGGVDSRGGSKGAGGTDGGGGAGWETFGVVVAGGFSVALWDTTHEIKIGRGNNKYTPGDLRP